MSISYSIVAGDTFESVSRKLYGTEAFASQIAAANPGLAEPLSPGTTIIVSSVAGAPGDLPQNAVAATEDEVAILIENERFRFWDSVRIRRAVDNIDVIEFGAPFEPDAPGFRETFRPFSFKPVAITVGGAPLFTGTMVTVDPPVENRRRVVTVGGYALPGVLNDCTAPAGAFPLEFNDQDLEAITRALCAPFGIDVDFQAAPGAVFERVASEPGKKLLSFFITLAKQRNLVIGNTPRGKLAFQQSVEAGAPVARLQEGSAPVLSITPTFNPQEYYSHITGLEPVFLGLSGSQFTVKNGLLQGVLRPHTFTVPDTQDADVKAAVEAKTGRMFGDMAAYSVRVATWRDSDGALWEPNSTITLLAPGAMVYQEYEFVIRAVEFEANRAARVATLELAVPGSFSGKTPEVLPWDT